MNHWIRAAPTAASAHPDTLSPGRYRLEGPAGALETQVASDATLARDVVVLPFGGETNPNVLISTTTLEPFTGQPISNGTPIRAIRIGKGEEGARNAHTDE
jgi:hypothetical protein